MDQRINYPLIITRISARLICYTKYNDDDYLNRKGNKEEEIWKMDEGSYWKGKKEKSKRNQRHVTILRIIPSKNRKVSRTIAVAAQTATIAMKELQWPRL